MSDENQVTDTPVDEQVTDAPKTYTQEDLDNETKALKDKLNQLMDETKSERRKRQELEQAQKEAQRQAMAEKEDFKGLYESQSAELEALRAERDQYAEAIKADKVDGNALKIAASIGIDEASQELLAEQAKKFIVFEDGKAKYQIGGVDVSKDEVIKTLSTRYPRLVKAVVPSGSGASPNSGGGAAPTGNPWKKGDSFNLTEQGRIMRNDPALAERLKKEAN